MKKLMALVFAFIVIGSGVAFAHQPVVLLNSDTTAAKGPLLVDGTVSFAVRASFAKAGERKAFRAQFKEGDALEIQYLIVDKKPENAVKMTQLPSLVVTGPGGFKLTLKLNERTKFFEPFSQTNYLYLGRYSGIAKAGIYSFVITGRGKSAITLGVGDREVQGEVVRVAYVAPTASASPTPVVSATPTPTITATPTPTVSSTPTPTPVVTPSPTGYTMAQVRANNTAKSCWTAIDGYVYNLTNWISAHPGGSGAILFLCGTDGTNAFKAQHENQSKPVVRLDTYRLGPLNR
jgi:cytochrome b involved in lipid metabolism